MFPELVDTVAKPISVSLLSIVLQKAIFDFPERVEPTIADVKDQQKRHTLHNPVGYLTQAIRERWHLSTTPRSISF